jgi:hypothetical protein
VTRALATLEELKAKLQAARAAQVYVEDHVAAEDHERNDAVQKARVETDEALQAVLDAIRPRTP